MHTIKTTALTFIAIFGCLMLLLTPEPQQVETPNLLPTSVSQSKPILFEPAPVVAPDQPVSVERDHPRKSFTPDIAEQTEEAPFILYPELEQIRRLEDVPVIQAIYELQTMLSDDDPVIRLAAIESLGDMTDQATLPALLAALNDPNPQLRIAALEALAAQEDESAVSSIEPYLYDEDSKVRVAAIEALEELESETAVPALAGLLSDQDVRIRNYAVNALGEIGGEHAISYLLQSRDDADETIRANANAILAELEI